MVASPDGKYAQWMIPGYNNVVLFPKSAVKDEAELKKILAFFDQMMTPEVANLMYWGIEGTHYTVEDGKAKATDDKELIEREVKGYKDSVIGEAETNGMYENYNTLPGRIHADQLVLENVKVGYQIQQLRWIRLRTQKKVLSFNRLLPMQLINISMDRSTKQGSKKKLRTGRTVAELRLLMSTTHCIRNKT